MQLLDLEILLDDDCLLAINKPSGLPTQAPKQFDSVERRVRAWLADRAGENLICDKSADGRPPYLGLPHRLDRPASGVLLLTKTPRQLGSSRGNSSGARSRRFTAPCVCGNVEPAEGNWHDYVRKLPSVPKVEIVAADAPGP